MTGSSPAGPGHRPTIKDVAALAGVSKGAVSMAFNGRPGVSEATRARVLAAAGALGWEPSLSARALSGSRTDTVGLAIARPARMLGLEPFYMEFISGIESVLAERGGALLLRLVKDADEEIGVQRAWWRSRQVSGSVLVDFRKDDPRASELAGLGLPAVAVGHPSLTGGLPSAWTDDAAAVGEAVRYLAALGHRRIARVGGAAELGHTAIRAAAFEAAAHELGLEQWSSIDTDFSGTQGARATRTLLASPHRPTAVLYDNDLTAVAGLSVAAEMGLSVPRDISLLAWDDSQLCRLTRPELSAMSHDVFGFGAEVARRLLTVLDGGQPEAGPVATPVLTPRGSTAPPRH
ncbi:LacI family DNA-binding transcriptional regulator [Actinacidiphila bryophytorum]|uniref:DNA-binding transcriptional regulator, LacI/PurR family n=1 Tax=Actinacidiphila bryophytorum TaxID=1436133 RepID=A0A9W4H8P5_9ACTN|nr:LacI family DNA-binding transcriptional regulator [Actinacidiphila bryophytorum]CAG7658399.1 DNA-binding transcriptional regulator, LacI/PurR family [Actinacidiphila bryophytorum]